MPVDSLLVAAAVTVMFVVFAAVLFWGDLQTRPMLFSRQPDRKRRAF